MAKVNRAGLQTLRRNLSKLALTGADAAAGVLADKLSGEGTGRKYPGLPRRSSSEHEYPAEQSSALKASIAARAAGPCRAEFGPIRSPPEYVYALHGKPPDAGGRPFMDDALQDRDIHDAVWDAMGVKQK